MLKHVFPDVAVIAWITPEMVHLNHEMLHLKSI